jgi:CrcB protein
MNRYLLVMLGAAVGGLLRYVVGTAVMHRFTGRFPLGTLVVNVTGCFLIGILMTVFTERGEPSPNLRMLLVVGMLGGFTTFSSFGWESFEAMEEGSRWIGFANIALSVIFGYLAVWCGAWLVRR